MGINTKRTLYYFLFFINITIIVVILHLFFFELIGATKNASNTTMIIMAALCGNDYLRYWLKHRHPDVLSNNDIALIIRIGNNSQIIQWIRRQPAWILFVLAFIWTTIFSASISLLDEPLPDIMEGKNIIPVIVVGILLGPLIETFLFQVCIIELLKKITPKVDGRVNLLFPLLVSAIFFALNHSYSINYMIYAFGLGVALSGLYILGSTKAGKTWKNGFWMSLAFHLGINLFALIGFLFENKIVM